MNLRPCDEFPALLRIIFAVEDFVGFEGFFAVGVDCLGFADVDFLAVAVAVADFGLVGSVVADCSSYPSFL